MHEFAIALAVPAATLLALTGCGVGAAGRAAFRIYRHARSRA